MLQNLDIILLISSKCNYSEPHIVCQYIDCFQLFPYGYLFPKHAMKSRFDKKQFIRKNLRQMSSFGVELLFLHVGDSICVIRKNHKSSSLLKLTRFCCRSANISSVIGSSSMAAIPAKNSSKASRCF